MSMTTIKRELVCTNEECDASSVTDHRRCFSITTTVNGRGEIEEALDAVDGDCFTCNYCHQPATWEDIDG